MTTTTPTNERSRLERACEYFSDLVKLLSVEPKYSIRLLDTFLAKLDNDPEYKHLPFVLREIFRDANTSHIIYQWLQMIKRARDERDYVFINDTLKAMKYYLEKLGRVEKVEKF